MNDRTSREGLDSDETDIHFTIPLDRTTPFSASDEYLNYHGQVEDYPGRYYRVAVWISLLITGYVFNRMLSLIGLPDDAQHHTWLGHARNISDLILLGFVQCWFVELIDTPLRWEFIKRCRWFYPLFFGTSLAYAILSSIRALQFAITDDSDYNVNFFILISIISPVPVAILVWHIRYAKRTLRSSKDFVAFVVFRVLTLTILSLAYYLIHSESTANGPAKLHLHHYFIAWLLSLTAAFNHPVSLAFLAVTTSIFVQGISAYSAASMFYRGDEDNGCPEVYVS